MDFVVVQLAILFLPGLIWARLDSRYAMKERPSETELLIRALMFGLATYAFVFSFYWCLAWEFSSLGAPTDAKPVLAIDAFVDEILISLPMSFVLATLWIAATNKKWLTRFLQWIGATRKYGDEDVWDFTLNSGVPEVEYVHLRDFDKSIVYAVTCGPIPSRASSENWCLMTLSSMILEATKWHTCRGCMLRATRRISI